MCLRCTQAYNRSDLYWLVAYFVDTEREEFVLWRPSFDERGISFDGMPVPFLDDPLNGNYRNSRRARIGIVGQDVQLDSVKGLQTGLRNLFT